MIVIGFILTYGKNTAFFLIHIWAGNQLEYVVVQLVIESGGFILAQLESETKTWDTTYDSSQ